MDSRHDDQGMPVPQDNAGRTLQRMHLPMNERYLLVSDTARRMALRAVEAAPLGYVCEVKERTRTSEQNSALHAMLADIAKQKEWGGKKRSVEEWKCLMVSAHRIAQKEAGEIVPGLEGEFVQLRKSTTAMGVKELGSLLDYMGAWCAANNVRLSAPAHMGDRT